MEPHGEIGPVPHFHVLVARLLLAAVHRHIFPVRAELPHVPIVLHDHGIEDAEHIPVVVHRTACKLAVGGHQVAVGIDRHTVNGDEVHVGVTSQPSFEVSAESAVLQVVGPVLHLEVGTGEIGTESPPGHLYLVRHVLARMGDTELAHRIQVGDVRTEILQPAEQVVVDALQVAETGLQRIVGVGLPAVYHVHVRGALPDRHQLDDALPVRVSEVVYPHEGIALGNYILGEPVHGCAEVPERHPVKAVFSKGQVAHANFFNDEFVLLGDIIAVILRRHPVVLLHEDDVVLAERVVQLAVLRVKPHLARFGVVMVHLHHAREGAVVVLAQHLRHDELEHTHRAAYNQVVELRHGTLLRDTRRVEVFLQTDGPSLACREAADEFLGRKVAAELGITVHLQAA